MVSKVALIAAAAAGLLLTPCLRVIAQNTPGMPPMPPQAPKSLPFVSPLFGDNMVLQRG